MSILFCAVSIRCVGWKRNVIFAVTKVLVRVVRTFGAGRRNAVTAGATRERDAQPQRRSSDVARNRRCTASRYLVKEDRRMVAKHSAPPSVKDESLNRRVLNFLQSRQLPQSQELAVESHFGTLVISGKLASRHDKWLCLECCRRVAGVVKLIDHVRVQPAPTAASSVT